MRAVRGRGRTLLPCLGDPAAQGLDARPLTPAAAGRAQRPGTPASRTWPSSSTSCARGAASAACPWPLTSATARWPRSASAWCGHLAGALEVRARRTPAPACTSGVGRSKPQKHARHADGVHSRGACPCACTRAHVVRGHPADWGCCARQAVLFRLFQEVWRCGWEVPCTMSAAAARERRAMHHLTCVCRVPPSPLKILCKALPSCT